MTINVRTGGSGGAAAKGAGTQTPKKKPARKSGEPLKLKDLLAHHQHASVYHRSRAGEHNDFVEYHNKSRDHLRHMGPVHAKIRDAHNTLADLYQKLGRDTYRASKVDPRERDKKKEKKVAKSSKPKKRGKKK